MAASGNNLNIYFKCDINQHFHHYQSPEKENHNPAIGDNPDRIRNLQRPRLGQPNTPQQPASASGRKQDYFPRQPQSNNDIEGQRPKYPQYADFAARLLSFKGFPTGISQKPEVLAEAGFFYTGEGDGVRCFHCGKGLCYWDDGDDPWIEHARWSEKCKYVTQKKGVAFINAVQKAVRGLEPSSHNTQDNKNDRDNSVEQSRLLQTPAIQSVMCMGYSIRTVLQARDIFQTKNGGLDYNAEDLMRIILEIEDNDRVLTYSFTQEEETKTITRCVSHESVLVDSRTSPKQFADGKPCAAAGDYDKCRDSGYSDVGAEAVVKENTELKQQSVCKICSKKNVALVFFPCGHIGSCLECIPNYSSCKTCAYPTQATTSV